ncbi:MAG: PDZ domain-containing protein [Candidatus Eisenbacteria bacterium]
MTRLRNHALLPVLTLALLVLPSQAAPGFTGQAVTSSSSQSLYIGVLVTEARSGDWKDQGLCSTGPGVRVVGVDYGSPADSARLREGDVITTANGVPIRSPGDLDSVLEGLANSGEVTLTVLREGTAREARLKAVELPRGYVGFDTVPLLEREALRDSLPDEFARVDSLPIVSWVYHGIPELSHAGLSAGCAVVTVGDRDVRSVSDLRSALQTLRIGDLVSLGFLAGGDLRTVRYSAQGPPAPSSGLNLEKITPLVAEVESLDVSGVDGGLYVRSVDPLPQPTRTGPRSEQELRFGGFSAATASGRFAWGFDEKLDDEADIPRSQQGDVLMTLEGRRLDSVETFQEEYERLAPGDRVEAVARSRDGTERSVFLDRVVRIPAKRPEPRYSQHGIRHVGGFNFVGAFEWQPSRDARRGGVLRLEPLAGLPFPVDYTKIDAIWLASSSLRWSVIREREGTVSSAGSRRREDVWTAGCTYGTDLDRAWLYGVRLDASSAWLPSVSYHDRPAPFRGQKVPLSFESWLSMLAFGHDGVDHVSQEGWDLRWSFSPPAHAGHRFSLSMTSDFEKPIEHADGISIFGARNYSPNRTEGVGRGRRRAVTLGYGYQRFCPARESGMGVEAEASAVGGALGGDFEFVRTEVSLSSRLKVLGSCLWDSRLDAGLVNGAAPVQDQFFLGGKATLPGYEDNQLVGDRVFLARSKLWLRSPDILGGFGPFVGLSAGDAWHWDEHHTPHQLRADVEIGLGSAFGLDDRGIPCALSVSIARPLDPDGGDEWRWHATLFGVFD